MMKKSIKIWKNRLKITKEDRWFMMNDAELHMFIYADRLSFGERYSDEQGWLYLHNNTGKYVGSIWVDTEADMKKVRQFLEETK